MEVFNNVTLTDAYVASDEKKITSLKDGVLYVNYTKDGETGMSVLVEFRPENDDLTPDWYSETKSDVNNNVSVVEHKMSATGKYRIPVVGGIGEKAFRVSIKANSTVPNYGTVSISAKL